MLFLFDLDDVVAGALVGSGVHFTFAVSLSGQHQVVDLADTNLLDLILELGIALNDGALNRCSNLIVEFKMAVFQVLLVPFNADGVLAAHYALAGDAGRQIADTQEVRVVQVQVEL